MTEQRKTYSDSQKRKCFWMKPIPTLYKDLWSCCLYFLSFWQPSEGWDKQAPPQVPLQVVANATCRETFAIRSCVSY